MQHVCCMLQIGVELTSAVQTALTASGIPAASISQTAAPTSSTTGQPQHHSAKAKSHQQQAAAQTSKASKAGKAHHTQAVVEAAQSADASKLENPAAVQESKPGKAVKPAMPSGDDLGDQFAVEIEAEENAGRRKQKKKTTRDTGSHPNDATGPGTHTTAKKSKHKVVSF